MAPSDEIVQQYRLLPPISLAWLRRLKELGVSVDALREPELPRQARIVMHGDCLDFASDDPGEQAVEALVFLARDDIGEAADLVAWLPKSDRLASWWGIPMLGMEALGRPRIDPDGALSVFTDPLKWLLAERNGLLVVNFSNAAHLLRDAAPLRATSAREAQRIQNLIIAAPRRVYAPIGSNIPVTA
jgi:hypothetical protein